MATDPEKPKARIRREERIARPHPPAAQADATRTRGTRPIPSQDEVDYFLPSYKNRLEHMTVEVKKKKLKKKRAVEGRRLDDHEFRG